MINATTRGRCLQFRIYGRRLLGSQDLRHVSNLDEIQEAQPLALPGSITLRYSQIAAAAVPVLASLLEADGEFHTQLLVLDVLHAMLEA